jgi:uridine phosphorylase
VHAVGATMGFPNFSDKYKERSMFEPSEFLNYLKSIDKYPMRHAITGAVFCYDRRLMDFIKKTHMVESEDTFFAKVLYLNDTHKKVAVIGDFGIGAPAAVVALEMLIALGAKKYISIGTAGTLQAYIEVGDLVVCDRAIRDEGVSHHYNASSKYAYPSEIATKKLLTILNERRQKFHCGTSWTIDAPYRETKEEAEYYQREYVAVVEMEAAALFSVAAYREVEMCSIVTVSDSLANLHWQPQFYHERTEAGLEMLYQIALEFMTAQEEINSFL